MPFRFKKSESLKKAVRRVGAERIRVALKRLEKADRPTSIHNVRKEIKKLRALLRLVRGELEPDDYKKAMRPLRRAAETMAASRDARVIFRAFENLVGDSDTHFSKLHKCLRKNWRRETRRVLEGNSVQLAEQLLKKAGRRIRKLDLKRTGWVALEPDLRQSCEQGRNTFTVALHEPSPENFHAWRKHVKTFWYQLQLIFSEQAPEMRTLMGQLDRLGEQLGEHHDLVLLKQSVADDCGAESDQIAKLGRLIDVRRGKLQQLVLKLGNQLFAEVPASVCRRMESHWHACHGNGILAK